MQFLDEDDHQLADRQPFPGRPPVPRHMRAPDRGRLRFEVLALRRFSLSSVDVRVVRSSVRLRVHVGPDDAVPVLRRRQAVHVQIAPLQENLVPWNRRYVDYHFDGQSSRAVDARANGREPPAAEVLQFYRQREPSEFSGTALGLE